MEIIALQIDLARQKESIEFVKGYADFAKANGYNTLFLYLEASVRTSITEFFDPEQSYSMEELAEMVDYIEGIGLSAVPAFENLYHMEKFLQYDELAHLSEFADATKDGRGWAPAHYPRGSVACVSNPDVNKFMDSYISEICSLFHGEYIHMGLDEIFEFAECEKCRARLAKGETKRDMFLAHTMHCYELAKSLGKRMMMWSDFFEYYYIVEELPRDIILCHWEYNFVGEEPRGHWTNRVKRDWLRIFSELGFEYMVCCWTTSASSILNLETLDNYASKFSPKGKLMTAWERESRFYHGNYPCFAYAGRLWSGRLTASYSDMVSSYAEFFAGSHEFAKLVLAIQVREGYFAYLNVSEFAETPYPSRYLYNKAYYYMVDKLGELLPTLEGDRTVAEAVYNFLSEQRVSMQIVELGNEIFDARECGGLDISKINAKIDLFEREYRRIKAFEAALWKECRGDIKSDHNAFESRWAGSFAMLERIRRGLSADTGILYLDLMVPDCYSSVKGEIFVKYKGDSDGELVYRGLIKPSVSIFENGGSYGFRVAIKDKPVDSIVFGVYGEGSLYPLHFTVMTGERKYQPKSVAKLSGEVEHEEKILLPDTTFASMGYERGIDHLNDGTLFAKRSSIEVKF